MGSRSLVAEQEFGGGDWGLVVGAGVSLAGAEVRWRERGFSGGSGIVCTS